MEQLHGSKWLEMGHEVDRPGQFRTPRSPAAASVKGFCYSYQTRGFPPDPSICLRGWLLGEAVKHSQGAFNPDRAIPEGAERVKPDSGTACQ